MASVGDGSARKELRLRLRIRGRIWGCRLQVDYSIWVLDLPLVFGVQLLAV